MTKTKTTRKPAVLVLGGATEPIRAAGGKATSVSPTDNDALRMVKKADALLLTGGGDVSPVLYGQDRHPQVYGLNEQRDLVELYAIEAAYERGIPIMGICRGSQILNVAFGGSLHQHIADLDETHEYHGGGHRHRVRYVKGSRLRAATRVDEHWVISIHHQAVDRVADGFVVTARALDGTVEAIEAVDRFILGVQYHPEMAVPEDRQAQRIFNSFVREAARVAGLKEPRPVAPRKPAKIVRSDSRTDWFHTSSDATLRRQAASGVRTSWQCFRCGIRFDDRQDHLDHMMYLHDVDFSWDLDGSKTGTRSR